LPELTEDILKIAFNLPPEKAVKYLEQKGFKFSWSWTDTWQEAHDKAFTVAKVMRADVLQSIRQMVQKGISEGITFDKFQRSLEPYLKLAGWWGRTWATDEDGNLLDETGNPWPLDSGGNPIIPDDAVPPQLGSPWRLQRIYDTNLQQSLNAGRYEGMMEVVEERPYWKYISVIDGHQTALCDWLNQKIFPALDAIWKKFYPMNHFGCRGRMISVSQHEVERDGLKVQSSDGLLGTAEALVSTKTGEVAEVATIKTADGTLQTAPGFSHGPGASLQPDLEKYDPDIRKQLKNDLAKK